ncbi:hypothetical protein GCM10009120_32300 [Sphingobacterium siyangense subsp. cladoniae]|uniref:glycosyltransferase n=1 Tax=Sphingobacterium siyangense TaxID=459529 RepID=UPI0031F8B69D
MLTIIIPFLNEGMEVRNTLTNIRQLYPDIPIIFINDSSSDNYSYEFLEHEPYVKYIINKNRLGVAASRDIGVLNCDTPNFLLLDAHVRIYKNDVLELINEILEQKKDRVLCFKNLPLILEDGIIKELNGFGYGANFNLYDENQNSLFTNTWINEDRQPLDTIVQVGCLLGGAYASTKIFWKRIRGLEGLIEYGCDEMLISFKTWLAGGECLLIKNITIGHIYRTSFPYSITTTHTLYNILYTSLLLLPPRYNIIIKKIAKELKKEDFKKSLLRLYLNNNTIINHQKYLKSVFKNDVKIIEQVNELKKLVFCNTVSLEKLELIYIHLKKNAPSSYSGYLDGNLGVQIFIFLYEKYIFNIKHNISDFNVFIDESKCKNFDLFKGFLGIGWGLIYLYQHNILKNKHIKEYILKIDKIIDNIEIKKLDLFQISNLLHYLLARNSLKWGKKKCEDFLSKLHLMVSNNKEFVNENLFSICKIEAIIADKQLMFPISFNDILNIDNPCILVDINSDSLQYGLTYVGICTLICESDNLI